MAVAEKKTRDLLSCRLHLGKREDTGEGEEVEVEEVEDSDDIITLLIINFHLRVI